MSARDAREAEREAERAAARAAHCEAIRKRLAKFRPQEVLLDEYPRSLVWTRKGSGDEWDEVE